MDWYTVGWISIIIAFGVLEWFALRNERKGDTASEHVWKWFSIKHKGTGWKLRRGALVLFMLWLTYHFVIG